MRKNTIQIGKILGIPIGLDLSWFLIFALVTWSLAVSYFPSEFKSWPVVEFWIVGAVTAVLFFTSVLVHELGHSVLALRYKVPVKSITLFIFGGVAQIESEPPTAMSEFFIAIAGPLTSFLLAGLFGLLQIASTSIAPLFAMFKYLAYINAVLGAFNLIPGFPLDGGRVFRAVVWGVSHDLRKATRIAAVLGQVIAAIFIMVGVWQVFSGNLGNGIWIAFIGWFLQSAAVSEVRSQRLHDLLEGRFVSQAMNTNCTSIPPNSTLEQLVDQHILGSGKRCLVVESGEIVQGLLTLHDIRRVPREAWSTTLASKAMTSLEKLKWVKPNDPLVNALQEMDRDGVNQLPVMLVGKLVGMLSREDVISYLRTLQELTK